MFSALTLAWKVLSNLPWRLIAYACVVAGLVFMGYQWNQVKHERAAAEELRRNFAEYQIKVDKAIKESEATNARILGELQAEEAEQNAIKDEVVRHLNSQVTNAQAKIAELEKLGYGKTKLVEVCSAGDLYRLDDWTLGMLHHAANPASAPHPSRGADEEVRTTTEVGASDLIEYQLTITRMYRELTKRHDELVDWVSSKMKELNSD